MKRILIVDDEPDFRSIVRETLEPEFQVLEAANGKEALAVAIDEKPDLILMDVNMPGMSGYEVTQHLQTKPLTRNIPVLFLTSETASDSRVRGYELGAEDFISKPVPARELLARVKARFKRNEVKTQAEGLIQAGNLRADLKTMDIQVDGKPVHLTQAEFELLRYFLENPNRVISREKILGDLWPDTVVTGRTVDSHVAHLRKKLKDFSCPLKTVFKVGYLLEIKK